MKDTSFKITGADDDQQNVIAFLRTSLAEIFGVTCRSEASRSVGGTGMKLSLTLPGDTNLIGELGQDGSLAVNTLPDGTIIGLFIYGAQMYLGTMDESQPTLVSKAEPVALSGDVFIKSPGSHPCLITLCAAEYKTLDPNLTCRLITAADKDKTVAKTLGESVCYVTFTQYNLEEYLQAGEAEPKVREVLKNPNIASYFSDKNHWLSKFAPLD